jgi:hypothetical protein
VEAAGERTRKVTQVVRAVHRIERALAEVDEGPSSGFGACDLAYVGGRHCSADGRHSNVNVHRGAFPLGFDARQNDCDIVSRMTFERTVTLDAERLLIRGSASIQPINSGMEQLAIDADVYDEAGLFRGAIAHNDDGAAMDHFGNAAFDEKYLKNLLLADPTSIARVSFDSEAWWNWLSPLSKFQNQVARWFDGDDELALRDGFRGLLKKVPNNIDRFKVSREDGRVSLLWRQVEREYETIVLKDRDAAFSLEAWNGLVYVAESSWCVIGARARAHAPWLGFANLDPSRGEEVCRTLAALVTPASGFEWRHYT